MMMNNNQMNNELNLALAVLKLGKHNGVASLCSQTLNKDGTPSKKNAEPGSIVSKEAFESGAVVLTAHGKALLSHPLLPTVIGQSMVDEIKKRVVPDLATAKKVTQQAKELPPGYAFELLPKAKPCSWCNRASKKEIVLVEHTLLPCQTAQECIDKLRALIAANANAHSTPVPQMPSVPLMPAFDFAVPKRGRTEWPHQLANYDSLNVPTIVAELDELTEDQLRMVLEHELANKNRKGVLNKLNVLLLTA